MGDIAQAVCRETWPPRHDHLVHLPPQEAADLIQEDKIDLVSLGRPLLADSHWPYRAAQELGLGNPA